MALPPWLLRQPGGFERLRDHDRVPDVVRVLAGPVAVALLVPPFASTVMLGWRTVMTANALGSLPQPVAKVVALALPWGAAVLAQSTVTAAGALAGVIPGP